MNFKNYFFITLIIAITVLPISTTANAQEKGDKAVGTNMVINSGRRVIGAGIKYQYYASTPLRFETSFNYMTKNYLMNKWDLFINCHFLIPIGSRFNVYPLAGSGILRCDDNYYPFFDEEGSNYGNKNASINWGRHFGAGLDFKISDKIFLNAELNYKILNSHLSDTHLSAGVVYIFSQINNFPGKSSTYTKEEPTKRAKSRMQEKGDKTLGANLAFNSPQGTVELLGIGAKFRYNVTNPFRLESSFDYIFEKESINRWNFFVNGHLLIPVSNKITIYPISGMGILGYGSNSSKKSSAHLGLNFGGGIDYKITDRLFLYAELHNKFETKLGDALTFIYVSTGVFYRFRCM